MRLTSKPCWLPATVACRRNQFTVHDKHLPAAGGWLMLISCSDSSCEAKAPSGKFTNKFCSQLSNHAALYLRKENPQTGRKCSDLVKPRQRTCSDARWATLKTRSIRTIKFTYFYKVKVGCGAFVEDSRSTWIQLAKTEPGTGQTPENCSIFKMKKW